jgi:hypothetical protein
MVFTGDRTEGRTTEGGLYVRVKQHNQTNVLSPKKSQALVNHSPNGFNWGYSGSGPAQLALALILHATGETYLARRYYQDFKGDIVAKLKDQWQLSADEIKQWIHNEQKKCSD